MRARGDWQATRLARYTATVRCSIPARPILSAPPTYLHDLTRVLVCPWSARLRYIYLSLPPSLSLSLSLLRRYTRRIHSATAIYLDRLMRSENLLPASQYYNYFISGSLIILLFTAARRLFFPRLSRLLLLFFFFLLFFSISLSFLLPPPRLSSPIP